MTTLETNIQKERVHCKYAKNKVKPSSTNSNSDRSCIVINTLSSPTGPSEDLTILAIAWHAITVKITDQTNPSQLHYNIDDKLHEIKRQKQSFSSRRAEREREYRFGSVRPDRTAGRRECQGFPLQVR